MTLRTKIAVAASFLLLTGGVAYAQSTMSCCDDCDCCEEMMARHQDEGAHGSGETPAAE